MTVATVTMITLNSDLSLIQSNLSGGFDCDCFFVTPKNNGRGPVGSKLGRCDPVCTLAVCGIAGLEY